MERNDFDFGIGHIALLIFVAGLLMLGLVLQRDARLAWLERQEQQPQILGEQTTNVLLPVECYEIPNETEVLPRAEDPEYGQC